MTFDRTIYVSDFKEISSRLRQLGSEWPSIVRNELADASSTVLWDKIYGVTPMSTLQNPIYRNKKGKVYPSLRPKIGKANLRNDLNIEVLSDGTIQVGFDKVTYARAVHDMYNGVNWSTPGTGPGFLDKPVMDNIDIVGAETATNIDRVLRERGI